MQIGSEMAALQEKNPKMDPKKRFFWKIPQDFELLKKVPQNIHQTGQFGWNRYIGIWNLSHGAFLTDVHGIYGWGSNLEGPQFVYSPLTTWPHTLSCSPPNQDYQNPNQIKMIMRWKQVSTIFSSLHSFAIREMQTVVFWWQGHRGPKTQKWNIGPEDHKDCNALSHDMHD